MTAFFYLYLLAFLSPRQLRLLPHCVLILSRRHILSSATCRGLARVTHLRHTRPLNQKWGRVLAPKEAARVNSLAVPRSKDKRERTSRPVSKVHMIIILRTVYWHPLLIDGAGAFESLPYRSCGPITRTKFHISPVCVCLRVTFSCRLIPRSSLCPNEAIRRKWTSQTSTDA